ncbi:MAG TPA: PQQ-binding-like beta-propeller repeat protein [Thermoanaerobaculia bacterium]|nr:PQQ-binding-like beta-propeller repeat protein [Thermoanaerobaculia bacterium]
MSRTDGVDDMNRRQPLLRAGIAPLLLLLIAPAVAEATGDWPHWRGPNRDGTSDEEGLVTTWSKSDNVLWRLELPGVSGATPIISGDRIFLNVGTEDSLELWSVDRASGEVQWKRELGGGNKVTRKQNMSSPSPVTDGERVFALTGTGILKAFSHAGEELWSRDLQADYGDFGLNWGYASSPLLDDGTLYVQVLHGMRTDDPSYVLAIDPATGENRWRVERPTDARMESPDSYTTPAVIEVGERRELVITGGDYVTGHDLATGRELWRIGGLNPERNPAYRIVASPVVSRDLLFVPSRVNPFLAFQVPREGEPELLWQTDRGTDVPTPATDGDSLYLVNDRGILRRLDARTGEETWEAQRLAQGTYSASPVLADGKLYVTNEGGTTSVVGTSGDFDLLAENALDEYTLASPAISDGRIFLRTDKALYSIGAR